MSRRLVRDIFIYLIFTGIIIFAVSLTNFQNFFGLSSDAQGLIRLGLNLISGDILRKVLGILIVGLTYIFPIIYLIVRIKKEERFNPRLIALIIFLILLLLVTILDFFRDSNNKINQFYYKIDALLGVLFIVVLFIEMVYYATKSDDEGATSISFVSRVYVFKIILGTIISVAQELYSNKVMYQSIYNFSRILTLAVIIFSALISIILFQSIIMYFGDRKQLNIAEKKFRLQFIQVITIILFIVSIFQHLKTIISYIKNDTVVNEYFAAINLLSLGFLIIIFFTAAVARHKTVPKALPQRIPQQHNQYNRF